MCLISLSERFCDADNLMNLGVEYCLVSSASVLTNLNRPENLLGFAIVSLAYVSFL